MVSVFGFRVSGLEFRGHASDVGCYEVKAAKEPTILHHKKPNP